MNSSKVIVHQALDRELPILPRFPRRDRKAWLKLAIATKKALDEAEKKVLQRTDLDWEFPEDISKN